MIAYDHCRDRRQAILAEDAVYDQAPGTLVDQAGNNGAQNQQEGHAPKKDGNDKDRAHSLLHRSDGPLRTARGGPNRVINQRQRRLLALCPYSAINLAATQHVNRYSTIKGYRGE